MIDTIWLLVWDDHHGCEGEGHAYVAAYTSEDDARFAADHMPPPPEFTPSNGSYSVYTVPVLKGE